MIDFLALFGLIFAIICIALLVTRQGIAASGFVVIAILAAMIAAGLSYFQVVGR